MVKRFVLFGGIAAALSAVLVAAFLIPAQSQKKGGTEILNLCLKEGRGLGFNHDVDVSKKGFSSGDYSLFTDKLYNRDTGKGYGHDVGRFTFVKRTGKGDGVSILDVTAVLPTGKLLLYAPVRFSQFTKGARMAITGGTGNFNNASGGAVVRDGKCLGHRGTRVTATVTLK